MPVPAVSALQLLPASADGFAGAFRNDASKIAVIDFCFCKESKNCVTDPLHNLLTHILDNSCILLYL